MFSNCPCVFSLKSSMCDIGSDIYDGEGKCLLNSFCLYQSSLTNLGHLYPTCLLNDLNNVKRFGDFMKIRFYDDQKPFKCTKCLAKKRGLLHYLTEIGVVLQNMSYSQDGWTDRPLIPEVWYVTRKKSLIPSLCCHWHQLSIRCFLFDLQMFLCIAKICLNYGENAWPFFHITVIFQRQVECLSQ